MEVFKFKYFDLFLGENIMKPSTDSVILGAWSSKRNYNRILDLGCGSGILGLMLAQENQSCEVVGIDLSKDAVNISNLNFTKSEFRNAFHFAQGDFIDFTSLPDPFFDLIISNPPYFIKDLNASEQSKNLQRHFTLKKISDLVFNVSKLLTDKGLFLVVLPVGLESIWTTELICNGLYPLDYLKIKHSNKSETSLVCVAYSRLSSSVGFEELVILDEEGNFSTEYINLTRNFISVL
jgi:tRNA1Val (adenine37-N6)-methyltransferase